MRAGSFACLSPRRGMALYAAENLLTAELAENGREVTEEPGIASSSGFTRQDACLMSVTANISSLAREYSAHPPRDSRSIGPSFQPFVASCMPVLKATLLLFVADGKPVLD